MTEFTPYRTEAEIEEVVRRFEACTYSPEEFVHAKHLTVAAWYAAKFDEATALDRMRSGLAKFIQHHRRNAYHETITRFWFRLVLQHVRTDKPRSDMVTLINDVVARLSDKNLIYKHYTPERINSAEAKAGWLAPDRLTMPYPRGATSKQTQ
jgi:hypothetical protein